MDLPPNESNARFFKDLFVDRRPALTMVGFDNGGDPGHGYGLRQILDLARDPGSEENHLIRELARTGEAGFKQWKRGRRAVADHNSIVVQAVALVALVGLVLKQNGAKLPGVVLPEHTSAMEKLKRILRSSRLLSSGHYRFPLFASEVYRRTEFDRVKWCRSLASSSRAIDLYQAIEIAYRHYRLDTGPLLDRSQKKVLLVRQFQAIKELLFWVDAGLGVGTSISGNWPLKMWAAAGYATLGAQTTSRKQEKNYKHWLGRAIRRCGRGDVANRRRYWSYNTSREGRDGQRTWAEGPFYMNFALRDALPFWHAVRANGKLDFAGVPIPDPFRHPWFVNPLNWLADISTPEGGTPPFDDGNRYPIHNAHAMRWSALYGDEEVGRKMAWIYHRVAATRRGVPTTWKYLNSHLHVHQLAIPKAPQPKESPLPRCVGNERTEDTSEEQLLWRVDLNGETHYVCLHGEASESTISRGEGHEQPDQLQLIYYIGDRSLLMDAGYDRGGIFGNSTWNAYSKQNVMAYADGDGGLSSPIRQPVLRAGVIQKYVSHASVETLYLDHRPSDRLVIMKGSVYLRLGRHRSLYDRTVLFVSDPTLPYLIDVNRVRKTSDELYDEEYRMRYYVDAGTFSSHVPGRSWDRWSHRRRNRAFLYLRPVEASNDRYAAENEAVWVRERFGKENEKKVQRLSLYSPRTPALTTMGVFVAGSVQPQSTPVPLIGFEDESYRTHQVWFWSNADAESIDVIFVRSPVDSRAHAEPVAFQIPFPVAGSLSLRARSHQAVGFARMVHKAGGWTVDPDFLYGLRVSG